MIVIAFAAIAVTSHGMHVNFSRSPQWLGPSYGVAALVNLLLIVPLFHFARTRGNYRGLRLNPFTRVMLAAPIFALTMFPAYFLVAYSLPAAYTSSKGTPFVEHQVPYSKRLGSTRRPCPFEIRARSSAPYGALGRYCAGPREFESLPDQGFLSAHGRQSWFGRQIDSVKPDP